jgi:uncharacterized protein with GYD domain
MPLYLVRFSYTPESWKRLIQKPEDRRQAVGELVESVGGKLHGFWYAFGGHDGYVLTEAPDNVAAAAIAVAASASGGVRVSETTVLLTVEEMLAALDKAGGLSLAPPGG